MANKKLSMSLTTWMCVPEFGMKDMEVLCRGSAFLVPTRSWNADKTIKTPKYHVLTCSHVVAPWKWPKLYPDEWLKHVNEKHTHYTIEMRYEHGVFINQGDLHPRVYHHNNRDLAAMHIEMEDDIVELYMGLQLETEMDILSEKSSYYPLKVGQQVEFHGHDVVVPFGEDLKHMVAPDGSKDYSDESKFDRRCVPTIIPGTVQGRTTKQLFTTTLPKILPVGMCGGPVVIPRKFDPFDWKPVPKDTTVEGSEGGGRKHRGVPIELSNPAKARVEGLKAKRASTEGVAEEPIEDENKLKFGKSRHICVGLLEGIVPVDHEVEEIRGSAVFVEGPDILSFLKEVESGGVDPVVGGEAAKFVGSDQDPTKMDLRNI